MRDLQESIELDYLSEGLNTFQELCKMKEEGVLKSKYLHILSDFVEPLAEVIKDAIQREFNYSFPDRKSGRNKPFASKILEDLDTTKVSFLVIKTLLGSISLNSEIPLTRLCSSIYDSIKYGLGAPSCPTAKKVNVGLRLLTCVKYTFEGFIDWEIDTTVPNGQYLVKLKDSKTYDKYKKALEECLDILKSPTCPMVVPPRPWTSSTSGGYLSDAMSERCPLIRRPKIDMKSEEFTPEKMPYVYKCINKIQETAWKLDLEAYEVLKWAFESNQEIGKLPSSDKEKLMTYPLANGAKPTTPDQKEVVHKWHTINSRIKSDNQSRDSKRLIVKSVFRITEWLIENEVDTVWFPYNIDYRGRVYPIVPTFNPQGIDYIKSLIQFKEARRLETQEAVDWLAIHGANLYGMDKLSLSDRVKWVKENEFNIQMACVSWKESSWWRKADKPFQFLAWCRDWIGVIEHGVNWESRTPVALDGSCSGIQHYSAMLKDSVGGEAVNLLPGEKPEDIYQVVANRCIEILDGKDDDLSKEWLGIGINRKLTKRSVMTLPYGLTKFSCRDYIRDFLVEGGVKSEIPLNDLIGYFADILWEAIGSTLIGAQEAMAYLKDVASSLSKKGEPIKWTTPTGFTIIQKNFKTEVYRTHTKIDSPGGLKTYKLRLNRPSDKLNSRKQANSLCPNFIHSYDAAHLMMSVNEASCMGIDDFSMIHDSFGCHASFVPTFSKVIKQQFSNLYIDRSPLVDLAKGYGDLLDGIIPPTDGDLDLTLVIRSDYAFS